MKAVEGKKYALIQNGLVHQLFTIDDLPEWHDDLPVVDVTHIDPIEVGYLYQEGQFLPPVPATND